MTREPDREELLSRLRNAEAALKAIREGKADLIVSEDDSLFVQPTSDRKLEDHLKQILRTIRSVHIILSEGKDLRRVLDGITATLSDNVSYYSTWIALLDNDGRLEYFTGRGFDEDFDEMERQLSGGNFTACFQRSLNSSEPLVIESPSDECTDCPLAGNYEGKAGLTFHLKSGKRLYGIMSSSVSRDLAGNPQEVKLFGELCGDVAAGISRLKLKEAERAAAEEKDRILNSISDAMISLSPEMEITFANRACAEVMGRDPGDILGQNIQQLFPETRFSIFSRIFEETMEKGEAGRFEVYYPNEPFDDWYDVRIFPAEDGSASIYFNIVTDRKRAELELRESRERLALSIEGAELGTWDWNIATGETIFNERWADMLGYSLSEIDQDFGQWERLVHPDDLPAVKKKLQEHLDGKTDLYSTEFRMRHRRGDWIWIHDIGRVLDRDDQGRPLRACGVHYDITPRKELDRRVSLLSHLMDVTPASITAHTMEGEFLFANRETLRMHGYETEEEFRKVPLLELDSSESADMQEQRFRTLREKAEANFDVFHRRRDGSVFPLSVKAKVIDWEGRPAVLSIATDISERVAAEKALRESEERFRILVENSPYAIMLVRGGRYIYCNPAGARLMGYDTPDEAVGKDPLDQMKPEFRSILGGRMKNYRKGKVNDPVEICFIDEKGREKWSSSTSVPVTMDGEDTMLVVGKEITERKRIEQENRRLEERFQKFQRLESVGRLAGGVAHDLNNLLTPILGYGEMLLDENSMEPGGREQLKQMVGAAEKARDLVHQLLAFSRRQTLEFSVIDLNRMLRDFSQLLRRTIREDIVIEYQLSTEPQTVSGDRGQLEQVLMNLAANAQDAMPEGGSLTISTRTVLISGRTATEPEPMEDGKYCSLQIRDSGCGMDRETADRVFEPFYTTKAMTEGTGLGLATVYGIVKQHSGYIWVKSTEGSGTVFSIFLPFVSRDAPDRMDQPGEPAAAGEGETILLVEDDAMVRNMTLEILTGSGYRVLAASDGEEALSIADSVDHGIDLLLTDVVMPGMNGRELYDALSRKNSHLKVLYVSGYPDDVIAERGIMEKGVNFIQKPFTIKEITITVADILRD